MNTYDLILLKASKILQEINSSGKKSENDDEQVEFKEYK